MRKNGTVYNFAYDVMGNPMMILHNGNRYYYLVNARGDVEGILNSAGTLVVEYRYDAWGRLLSTSGSMASTLGLANPLRYRGYVYDRETGLYYLQSRYYNPEIGRFINADGLVSTGQGVQGNNMFAYCGNNPIIRSDLDGNSWVLVSLIIVGAALLLGGCSADTGAATPYEESISTNYNCYAYAMGEDEWKYVGGSQDAVTNFNIDAVTNMVLSDAQRDGRSIRIIDSYDSEIGENEYRIALRTGENDYHFMKQHSDGSWSHKPGFLPTRLINGKHPDAITWDSYKIIMIGSRYIEMVDIQNYYDSRTIYFAVTI